MKALIVLSMAAAAFGQTAHQHHPPHDAQEYARVLDDPKRDAWQLPHEVITALELRRDEVIGDIGTGTGYFAKRFAHHAAKVYAVDIDPELLEMARKDAPSNIEFVLAQPDDPRLPDGSIDTIFFCDVLHHIENRPAYYARLKRALRKNGRIVIVDFETKETPVGPPQEMRLSRDRVIAELKAAGFGRVEETPILPYQYFLTFRTGGKSK